MYIDMDRQPPCGAPPGPPGPPAGPAEALTGIIMGIAAVAGHWSPEYA